MTKLNVYYHPSSLEHKGFPGFSERPARLKKLTHLFNEMALPVIQPQPASEAMLKKAHAASYIDHVKEISEKGLIRATVANFTSEQVQWYTRVSHGSYKAAVDAAGAVCQAVEDTLSGKCTRAFCAVRPPGHHAGPERGEGFCLFNNVAVGALHALESGAQRVAVIDFDRHHGNGTQDIIENSGDGRILFISSFQEGCKYNHNSSQGRISPEVLTVPIPGKSAFDVVESLYRTEVIPALREFKPDLIIISAGFDMHKSDPLTNLKLESKDYGTLTSMIVDAANELCQGRVVSALEGGYELKALESCVRQHLQALQK